MIYIQNIELCFNDKLYDFFDWNKITRVKKIPIIKISNQQYQEIVNNKVIIDLKEEFIIITNKKSAIALNLKNNTRSSLMFDDEDEVLKISKKCEIQALNYKIEGIIPISFKTYNEEEKIKKLNNNINNLYHNLDYEKLKYIYFECFNKSENNIELIVKTLLNSLENKEILIKIENIFKLILNV